MPLSQVPPELMSQLPAGANAVDAVKVPGGEGYWVLGADGGVFSVGGAPFMGAYTTLPADARQGTRTFTNIIARGPSGYTLISNRGELYQLGNDEVVKEPTPTAPTVESVTPGQRESAKTWLRGQLKDYGLEGLGDWALERYNTLGGGQGAADAVFVEMKQQEPYKQRFKGMALREQNGYGPMTEAQYIEWENTYKRTLQNAGLPADWYDHEDDYIQFIGNNVDPTEVKERVEKGYMAAMSAPAEVRDQLRTLFGIDDKQLAAFFLDPKRAEEIWTKNLTQAQIAGAASMQKFGQLSEAETARLASQGLDFAQASERFGILGLQDELFTDMGEGGITREQQIGAAGGEAQALQQIETQKQRRKATFEQGGGFAAGQGGVSGLGEAT